MRKQTKLVAVLSATALLALGASFTSMAATYDWKNEDGEWYCYDKDGEMYEDAWVESAGVKYYVDDNGQIVKDSWIEGDNDELYYVTSDGSMLTNNWKEMLAFDADEDEDEEAWFYFGTNGKLATEKRISWKDSYYYVDENGKMLTGWVEYSKTTDETVCKQADKDTARARLIYCNEDGSRAANMWLNDFGPNVTAEEAEEKDEDDKLWYWIKSNGAVQTGRNSDINGETYFFDSEDDGHMLTGWVKKIADENKYVAFDGKLGTDAQYKDIFFCGDENEGWVKKNRWVETYAPVDFVDADADIDDTYWYWISKEGYVFIPSAEKATAANAVNLVNGTAGTVEKEYIGLVQELEVSKKTYLFDAEGKMQHDLVEIGTETFYYGGEDDGAKKTGTQTIKDDSDDAYTFFFAEDDDFESEGAAVTGTENKYLYKNGILQTAESDDVFAVKVVNGKEYIVDENGKVQSSPSKKYELEGYDDLWKATFDGKDREKNYVKAWTKVED